MHPNDQTQPRAPDHRRFKMAHPWMTREAYARLLIEAERRNLHPDKLAAAVLDAVAGDDLWAAVLDR